MKSDLPASCDEVACAETTEPEVTPPTLPALRAQRAEIIDTASQRGARDVRVFGSVARGVEGQGSDVDLLVRFEPGRSLLDLGGVVADLEDLLGCRVNVVTAEELGPRRHDRVLAEAVEL